ncbi:MAG: type II toxin-antitoxin system RelE/ParE family toxin [Burkholderiaceae bacterium]|nr:type II toxin-antitoxin system RelE/ParE family toxin [Burkholderiaceae bacterium]
MRLEWLRVAIRNLEAEADYIARESPENARAFLRHLTSSVKELATHPHLGRPGRVLGTRELVITRYPYIVPYRIRENSVEILRVLHTSRAWPDDLPARGFNRS